MYKSQLKIIYLVTKSDFGGAQRYVYDLAANLSQNFTNIIAGGEPGDDGELAKKLNAAGIRYLPLSHLKRAISPWHDWLAFWQIVKLIKKEKPDIIHLNSSKISILGSIVVALFRVLNFCGIRIVSRFRVIYTVHGWVFNEDLPWWKKTFYLLLEKWTAKFKTDIICLSEFEKQNAIRQKIAPAEKIKVIYNGIAPIDFLPREQARKKLSAIVGAAITDETILIGSIGNLYKNKGYEYLISAIDKLLVTGYSLLVTIIGSGPEQNNLQLRINNYELENKIILTGAIPNAAQLLPAFDIYVCSSIKEGLPYSILEAMQAGLPIVATSVGAIPEVIKNSRTGMLVQPKNAAALADKLNYALHNLSLAQSLGVEAKKQVTAQYALQAMIEKTASLYRR